MRVHSQCLTGDVLASLRCDCRAQLEFSLKKIGQAPSGILALPASGRPRHRSDEQTARLSTARRRHGHGRSQSITRFCRRRARLRFLRANPEATRRKKNPPALKQSGKSSPTGKSRYPRGRASSLPAPHLENFPRVPANQEKKDGPHSRRCLSYYSVASRSSSGGRTFRERWKNIWRRSQEK